jgi:hypothetical protein
LLEDPGKTIESVKNDIKKIIVEYTFVLGKKIIKTDNSIVVLVDLAGNKKGKN